MPKPDSENEDLDEETDYVPMQYQRAFGGAGLKRKQINFVPASSNDEHVQGATKKVDGKTASDLYLSIVMKKTNPSEHVTAVAQDRSTPNCSVEAQEQVLVDSESENHEHRGNDICAICGHAIREDGNHETSIVHQIASQHSHPPSALDRRRKGLAYLNAQGWDEDSRQGLGTQGAGRLYPVRAEMKTDKSGIGMRPESAKELMERQQRQKRNQTLDAAGTRKMAREDKAKAERLRKLLYEDDKVTQYLGPDS